MISRLRPKFTRQLPIGAYVADYACRQAKLIVELDGGQHAESEHDKRRDAFLAQEGWTILRVWNNEIGRERRRRIPSDCGSSRRVPRRHPPPAPPFQGGKDTAAQVRMMQPATHS
jgi:hypothetical protein